MWKKLNESCYSYEDPLFTVEMFFSEEKQHWFGQITFTPFYYKLPPIVDRASVEYAQHAVFITALDERIKKMKDEFLKLSL